MTFADILKQVLNGSDYPQNNDVRMAIPPMDGENAGKVMTPDRMQTQGEKPPADTVFKDNGDIAMDTNPFKSMIDKLPGGGQGTMTGMLKMLFGSDMKQEKAMDRSGITPRMGGDGDPNTVPGQGQDAVLNPKPMAKQRQKMMQVVPPQPTPPDYSMPTALDPQSIEELRTSLLTQAGQMDPGNPNGLAGRMSSPLAPSDMGRQSQEAINISDDIRGHNGRKSAAIKKGNIR